MSASGGSGGGFNILSALREVSERPNAIVQLVTNPVTYIAGAIATWVVTNLLLRPLGVFADVTATATGYVRGSFDGAFAAAAGGLEGVSTAIVGPNGAIAAVFDPLQASMTSLGIAAPLATTLTTAVLGAVVTMVIFVVARVLIDLIPGGGAFL